jgi:hypothetical protein
MNKQPTETNAGSQWTNLFKIAGVSAILVTILGLVEVVVEATGGVGLTSTPSSVQGWFLLLQTNPLLGLANLGIFEIIFFPLGVLMFMGLYFALRRTSESIAAIATALYFISATIYFASNNALTMLNLSNQYAISTTEAQRTTLLAAGQAIIAAEQGTGMVMTFFLGSLASLMVSVIMLKSKTFGKQVAIIGIIANLLGLPGSALGLVVWSLNGILMMVWAVIVGFKLLRIARNTSKKEVTA